MPTRFQCDLDGPRRELPHVWEHSVGSGHATLALRADWQRQLARCHRELGFEHVRFHGILDDDVGTLVCEENSLVYSFFNVDQIMDFLLAAGMRPIVELSFMPTALASGGTTVFHYRGNVTPPKDYDAWETLIHRLATHWIERYGAPEVRRWMFEVWNEPNLKAFWTGDQAAYFKLYRHTARGLKDADAGLRVGGPATAANAWIPEFVEFCASHDVPADFVSTHHYPTDAFGEPGDDTVTQLAASHRGVLREEATKAREQAGAKPLYYTEWSSSSNPFDDLHDQSFAAAYIIKTVLDVRGLVEGYSYWAFSDLFEENFFASKPFHGGFGLMTIDGIPKPSYRAYELLHRLGTSIVATTGFHETVDVWFTLDQDRAMVIVTNGALPRHPIRTEQITLRLLGVAAVRSAMVERIDADHANPRRAWMEMGQPPRLTPREVATLELASLLVREPIAVRVVDHVAELELSIPPQGIAMITLEL